MIVAPATCTILGLIFAVLTEPDQVGDRVQAHHLHADGDLDGGRGRDLPAVYQENPDMGVVNATLVAVSRRVRRRLRPIPDARPREDAGLTASDGAIVRAAA